MSKILDRSRKPQLICFSHLRWDFVLQRPQHLLTRFAATYDVVYWEEPVYDSLRPRLETVMRDGIIVAVPHLVAGMSDEVARTALVELLDLLVAQRGPVAVRWYYTPMMLAFSRQLKAACTVYDCMDELANFKFAPPGLLALEGELLSAADCVFTGGYSLYEAKRDRHPRVKPFPSSVDTAHFARARDVKPRRAEERPRLGFYGVIDERIDLSVVAALAEARPEWDIEMVGPIAKIDPCDLPQRANLSYPGSLSYEDLPTVLGTWDVALMPFAINKSTRFISPTKTPEYLAGGRPVVSTPVVDVVRHYGSLDSVIIADGADEFVRACDAALAMRDDEIAWLPEVDRALATMSWDRTAAAMKDEIDAATAARHVRRPASLHYDVLVVGAGFAGSVMAERLASDSGLKVLVIDRRPHIAGNAYDRYDAAGILMHQYGPHIFHTNSAEVVDYLSRFTKWRPYEHRVLAAVAGKQVPMPINRTTLNLLYGLDLETDAEAQAFLASRAEPVDEIRTSEDVVVNAIGRELYETFFRGYTRKQWALDPSELDKSVTARVPTRTNTDDRYFTDSFQAMPAEGYTKMFQRMLDHPNIEVVLGVDYKDVVGDISFNEMVFTGPIDEYFGYRFGKLPYRSLRFEHQTVDAPRFQSVGTVNYPDEAVPFTRISEYKHLTGQESLATTITYEFPAAEGDPYYPIPRSENQRLFKRYEALADAEPGVTFVGRLATYRYYNMDQVVAQALATYRRWSRRLERTSIEEVAVAAA